MLIQRSETTFAKNIQIWLISCNMNGTKLKTILVVLIYICIRFTYYLVYLIVIIINGTQNIPVNKQNKNRLLKNLTNKIYKNSYILNLF